MPNVLKYIIKKLIFYLVLIPFLSYSHIYRSQNNCKHWLQRYIVKIFNIVTFSKNLKKNQVNKNRLKRLVGIKSKPVKILIWLKLVTKHKIWPLFTGFFFTDKLLKLGEMRDKMTELNYRKLCWENSVMIH